MIKYFTTPFLFLVVSANSSAQLVDSIAHAMFEKTREIKTLTYEMTRKELYHGELKEQKSFIKLQRNPFKVYSKQLAPEEGLEVLYKEGDETALINPNGFPWFNIRLDPLGSRMTKGQHHTIRDPGFDRFVDVLDHLFNKYKREINEMAHVETTKEGGGDYWILSFENPKFEIIEYEIKPNETIWDLCYRKQLSPYMLVLLNDDMEDYYDFEEGNLIKIPNDYSPKMILKIEKKRIVPTEIKVYFRDELFEHYNFEEIVINPPIKDEEFESDYSEYGF